MKNPIIISNDKFWIKKDAKLPKKFNQMGNSEKRNYISNNKLLHRKDGPAVIYFNKTEFWYLNGLLHREDEPAVIWKDGSKEWWLNGLCHRLNGPAVIDSIGTKSWYLNGLCIDGKKYSKIQNCNDLDELKKYKNNSDYEDLSPLIDHRLNLIGNKFEVDIFFKNIFQLNMISKNKKLKKQDILNFINNMTLEDFKKFLIENIKDITI